MAILWSGGAECATTLISRTGYSFGSGITPNPGQFTNNLVKAVDFYLQQGESNVNISALIGTLPGNTPGLINAYLVQNIGANALVAPVAQTTIAPTVAADGSASPTTLFSDLALPAGQYFLVLYDTSSSDYWQYATSQTVDPSVQISGYIIKAPTASVNPWDSAFSSYGTDPTTGVGYGFTVSGTPASLPTSTPLISNSGYSFPAGVTPNPGLFNPSSVKAADFSFSQPETNVTISALLGTTTSGQSPPDQVTAYLVSAIGPSATSSPIAEVTVPLSDVAQGSQAPTTLFTGLALPAGQYYLVLYDPNTVDYWQYGTSQVLNSSVTTSQNIFKASGSNVNAASPWESTFTATSPSATTGTGLGYTVTGAPGPIPATSCVGSASLPYALSLYNLREQVSANDVLVASGDQLQAGAYCVLANSQGICAQPGSNAGVTGAALTLPRSFALMQANDALNPNHLVQYVPVYDSLPPIGPWTMTFTDSGGSSSCNTPSLIDNNGIPAPVVGYAQNITFSTTSGTLTPTLTWTEPANFLSEAALASGGGGIRIQLWDLAPTTQTAFSTQTAPLQIYAATVPSFSPGTSQYSFTIPSTWTTNGQSGYQLYLGHPYDIEIQSLLFRTVPGSTGNPNVVSRSRVFTDYTPVTLPAGVTSVQLPTVSTGSSGTSAPVATFNTTVSANTAIYVETPAPSSQTLVFAVGATDPNFQSVSAPTGTAFDGAAVYLMNSGGVWVSAGVLQNGQAFSFGSAGVSTFELVLASSGSSPAVRRAATQARPNASGAGADILGLAFTASGSFTGTVVPQTSSAAATPAADGPMPEWALVLVALGLMGIATRRFAVTARPR
jgi:hypothetical protein